MLLQGAVPEELAFEVNEIIGKKKALRRDDLDASTPPRRPLDESALRPATETTSQIHRVRTQLISQAAFAHKIFISILPKPSTASTDAMIAFSIAPPRTPTAPLSSPHIIGEPLLPPPAQPTISNPRSPALTTTVHTPTETHHTPTTPAHNTPPQTSRYSPSPETPPTAANNHQRTPCSESPGDPSPMPLPDPPPSPHTPRRLNETTHAKTPTQHSPTQPRNITPIQSRRRLRQHDHVDRHLASAASKAPGAIGRQEQPPHEAGAGPTSGASTGLTLTTRSARTTPDARLGRRQAPAAGGRHDRGGPLPRTAADPPGPAAASRTSVPPLGCQLDRWASPHSPSLSLRAAPPRPSAARCQLHWSDDDTRDAWVPRDLPRTPVKGDLFGR